MRSRIDRSSAVASARHSSAVAWRRPVKLRAGIEPGAIVLSPSIGSMSGSGPSGSYSDRSRFQSCSRKTMAVGPLTC